MKENNSFRLFFLSVIICITIFIFTGLESVTGAVVEELMISIPETTVQVSSNSQGETVFTGKHIQFLSPPGSPDLPYQVFKILLPADTELSSVKASIDNSDYVQMAGLWLVKPAPFPMTQNTNIDLSNLYSSFYDSDSVFPENAIYHIQTGNIRGWLVAEIIVSLFQYNPVTKALYQLSSNDLRVHYTRLSTPTNQSFKLDLRAEPRVQRTVINFKDVSNTYKTNVTETQTLSIPTMKNGSYAIITTDEILMQSCALDAFIYSKEQKGYQVILASQEYWGGGMGDEAAENIRNWLIFSSSYYGISYVLLIGNPHPETGDVPMKMLYPLNNITQENQNFGVPSDYYYADLTGNWDLDEDENYGEWGLATDPNSGDFGVGGVDREFELAVGRIPYYGDIQALDEILTKLTEYDNESAEESQWRKNVLLPMKSLDSTTPTYFLGEAIKNNILMSNNWAFHRIYDHDYGIIPTPETVGCNYSSVLDAWTNQNYGAIIWWTHGNVTQADNVIQVFDIINLDNAHPGFVFQTSCMNAYPEQQDNLAYELLKHGAISTTAATRETYYYSGEDNFENSVSNAGIGYAYMNYLINDQRSSGEALNLIKQTLYPNGPEEWANLVTFCLYGDPEMVLSSDLHESNEPPVLSNIADSIINENSSNNIIQFTVNDPDTPLEQLLFKATSSNSLLIPDQNILILGSGTDRTLSISPLLGQLGTSVITIEASDYINHVSLSFQITVKPSITEFSANITSGVSPLFVQFSDQSNGSILYWYWDFGDNTTCMEQNPIHIYEQPGVYTISLTVFDLYGPRTIVKEDYIQVNDQIQNAISPNQGTNGSTFTIQGQGFGQRKSKVYIQYTNEDNELIVKYAQIISWSDTEIMCQWRSNVPEGSYEMYVMPFNESPILMGMFSIQPPQINQVVPLIVSSGDILTIEGSYFGDKKLNVLYHYSIPGTDTIRKKRLNIIEESILWQSETGYSRIQVKVPEIQLNQVSGVISITNTIGSCTTNETIIHQGRTGKIDAADYTLIPNQGVIGSQFAIHGVITGRSKPKVFIEVPNENGELEILTIKVLSYNTSEINCLWNRRLPTGEYLIYVTFKGPGSLTIPISTFSIQEPVINSLSSTSPCPGEKVTMTGKYFGDRNVKVLFTFVPSGKTEPASRSFSVESDSLKWNPLTGESELVFIVPEIRLEPLLGIIELKTAITRISYNQMIIHMGSAYMFDDELYVIQPNIGNKGSLFNITGKTIGKHTPRVYLVGEINGELVEKKARVLSWNDNMIQCQWRNRIKSGVYDLHVTFKGPGTYDIHVGTFTIE